MSQLNVNSHEYFMNEALKEAHYAFSMDEVPVGAIVVCQQKIIARAHNQCEKLTDCTAHAEMLAITSASNYLGSKYLNECSLYVTLEPCPMCAGAIFWSQMGKVIFGASDEKRGYRKLGDNILHPKTKVVHSILEHECSTLIKKYFELKRD